MIIRNQKEIAILRKGGKYLAHIMSELASRVVPGISGSELNGHALKLVRATGGEPAFLGYTPRGAKRPYPAALCVSVNDEIVHGIPNEKEKVLHDGDVVTLDMGLTYQGLVTDMAVTVSVGGSSKQTKRLIDAAQECLKLAIATARIGNTTGDIGTVVESTAERYGYSVPYELGGHGVGRHVHEDPFIPNTGKPGEGVVFEEGMVLAIEPIVIAGDPDTVLSDDDYTFTTKDGSRTAQFEHTILVTDDKPEVLTE